jgi:hypothetical protein
LEYCAESSAPPGLVGILENKHQIFRRVKMIANFKRHPRWSISGLATVAVLALATLTGAQPEKTAATGPRASTTSAHRPASETARKVEPSRVMNRNVASNKLAALLEKYPKLEGTVYSPAGQAVSNADILIYRGGEAHFEADAGIVEYTGGEGGTLGNRQFLYQEHSTIFSTRTDGHFTIPLIREAHIYAAHECGFAQLGLGEAKSPLEIHLLPWGRIEGTVTLEGKPAPHQKLELMEAGEFWPPSIPHLALWYETESDDQGRFVFEGVPPEEVKVCRKTGDRLCDDVVVDVVPGVTTFCEHGFNGRVIKGHFVTSDSSKIENWKHSVSMSFTTKYADPDPLPNADPAKWEADFWQFEEGQAARRGNHTFAPTIEPNGDFQIEDVPPGTYELRADLYEGRGGPSPFIYLGGKFLGLLEQQVTIPVAEKGQANSPLDLGTLAVPILDGH